MNNKIIKKCNYTYNILKSDLDFLKFEYPYIKMGDIGESTLGEKIKFIKIGNGAKKIMINASHHANEWMTSLVIMMFLENYLELYNKKVEIYKGYKIREIWDNVSTYIIPMVNPDGVNLVLKEKSILNNQEYRKIWVKYYNKLEQWKSNIRGVDLNLNYPSGWKMAKKNKKKITKPGPRDYVGPNPLSEKETQSMYNFTMLHKFDLTISLHSQGKEIYWSYLDKKNKEAYKLGKELEKVSGYKLTTPSFYSSFAGYKDWFIDTFNKISYTIEIGEGEEGKSLPLSKAQETYEQIEELLLKVLEYYVEK